MDCDYVIFVTIIAEYHLETTVCFYARDKALADLLVHTLRAAGTLGPKQFPIRNVTAARL